MSEQDILKKLDSINEKLTTIEVRLSVIEVDLRHHIKRSDKHERLLMGIIFAALAAGGASAKYLFPILGKLI